MRSYPRRTNDWRTCADANNFYLVKLRKRLDELRHFRVGKREDVAAGKEHVAHFRMSLHVFNAGSESFRRIDDRRLPENELSRAMRASAEAAVRRHDEHTVGKPLLKPRRQRTARRQFSKRIPATHRTTSLE